MKKEIKNPIETYLHTKEERLNNPPVGMVTPETDPDGSKKSYSYDPHIDPQLQWAGKQEHLSFEVPTVSLHVHERIDPLTIIDAVRKKRIDEEDDQIEISLFSKPEENPPLREAIQFYKHKHNWSNRLIAGDSLLVMNSLLEKEGMGGKVQTIYFDPPYGIKYGSNFQPFTNKKKVDDKDDDMSIEPETIKAFRDTWELGIHSYLTYIRDRLLLSWQLLDDTGSIFLQINDNNLHLVKNVLDEIFGYENCVNIIPFKKRASFLSRFGKGLFELFDYIVWFAKDIDKIKVNPLYIPVDKMQQLKGEFRFYDDIQGIRKLSDEDILNSELDLSRVFRTHSASKKSTNPQHTEPVTIGTEILHPPIGHEWKANPEGMKRLVELNRLVAGSQTRPYKIYFSDFPYQLLNNLWDDTLAEQNPIYAVQTDELPIQRCILLSSDPGDVVLDITCGSGTSALVAEQWGRRWITCDTSRVAITLTKIRLMSSTFPYYELAHPSEGIGSGFNYKSKSRIKLETIARNEPPEEILLYDKPIQDSSKARVTGPFTVEAVPAPAAKSIDEIIQGSEPVADNSLSRSGETLRQAEWRDELLKTGVRGKNNQYIKFSRIEPIPGCQWIHADGETNPESTESDPVRVAVSFASEFMPLEQRQVSLALDEAQSLIPKPKILIFAAFQFDPEAAKDIDETNWPGVQMLRVQMNADLLTEDLKKKRASNDSFWLIGQPEVIVEKVADDKYKVKVMGFDYYNTRNGQIESGGKNQIALWMLDTDYDGRAIFPKQVFLPMAGDKDGWSKLARDLKASIDDDLIEKYRSTESLPFSIGNHRQIAVKIVDDRGIESLVVKRLD
ncbi:MAG: site-specific DNA-methyltransferase [Candidatus Cloacimonadaceae bacterium]|nr:site-specific DNA-methyltransferase [Candidatus Cloacimonadaceae bacterium]